MSSEPDAAGQRHPVERLPEDWEALLLSYNDRAYRGRQVFRWIHQQGEQQPEKMTNLPMALRSRLVAAGSLAAVACQRQHRSVDGTRTLLVACPDGARVECVLIPMRTDVLDEDEAEPGEIETRTRVTLCVSTQHGCAMGCAFCASGRAGLMRGLTAAEIVGQVLEARRCLEGGERLTNLVFMGMGEPLHNYDATARAIRLLTHPEGLDLSLRRITVSTVGLVKGIERLGRDFDGKVGLAVSLHAPDDELRSRLIPVNHRIPLASLLEALRRYPLPKRRRLTIEYTMLRGLNDSREQAKRLTTILRGLRVKINLIPMNPIPNSSWLGSDPQRVLEFREWVAEEGYSCFARTRRGDELSAACGQLALFPSRESG